MVRSSIGGFIDYDKAGPLSKLSLNLTYGYHFSPQLFGYNEDYLSIGFGVQAGRYRFDPSDLTAYDGIIGDPMRPVPPSNQMQQLGYSTKAPVPMKCNRTFTSA